MKEKWKQKNFKVLKQRTLGRDILLSEHSHSYATVIFPGLTFSWFTSTFHVNHVAIKKKFKLLLQNG